MKHVKIKIWLFVLLIAPLAHAAVHYVPGDYSTIKAAVNACSDWDTDTVIVAPGIYKGSENRDINLNGKTIILRSTNPADPLIVSTTVIDCEDKGRGFIFKMAENGDSTVAGFTVTNGNEIVGGAIYCSNRSSPLITNCVFINNSAACGGAIACANTNTSPKITNCTIKENSAVLGGGIYCNGASPNIANSFIIENSAQKGAAVYTDNAGKPVIENCTISQNTAASSAGGIYCYQSSNLTANNTILWANTAPSAAEIRVGNSGLATTVQLYYCDVRNPAENTICDLGCFLIWGPGNINIDPNFVDPGPPQDDYHLLKNSPCVDAGDPGFIPDSGETDIDGDPRIAGTKIDIGADEVMLAISVDVEITPKTLNLQSNGNWINCAISLGDGYNITDVNIPSIMLNDSIEPEWSNIDQEEQKLLVKFNREEIQEMLKGIQEISATLTVTGRLNDGPDFEGEDTIRLVKTKGKN